MRKGVCPKLSSLTNSRDAYDVLPTLPAAAAATRPIESPSVSQETATGIRPLIFEVMLQGRLRTAPPFMVTFNGT